MSDEQLRARVHKISERLMEDAGGDEFCTLVAMAVERELGHIAVEGTYHGPEHWLGTGPGYGHSWNVMADDTLIDGSAGQFDTEEPVRIIPSDDVRHSWYKRVQRLGRLVQA